MPVGSAHASLDQRIAAAPELTPTVRRIAEYLLSERERVPFLTAADIAAAVGASRLSVLRAARALGYAGLAELKRELAHALQRSTAARRFVDTAAHLDARHDEPLERAFAFQVEALQETRRATSRDDINRAVDLLAKAKRIVAYGQETARGLADAFVQRLRRTGSQAFALDGAGVALADELMQLRAGDVVIAVADENDPHIPIIVAHAIATRVPCVLVTNTIGVAQGRKHVVSLNARRGPAGDAPTFAADLLVLETLSLGLAARRSGDVRAARRYLGALRERLAPANGAPRRPIRESAADVRRRRAPRAAAG
jgi:DNA-binding MurR/RpiR family transcriptional regulator